MGHFFSRFETVFLVYEANSPLPNQSTDKSILHICLKLNLVQKHCANHWDVYYWNQTIFMSSKIDTHSIHWDSPPDSITDWLLLLLFLLIQKYSNFKPDAIDRPVFIHTNNKFIIQFFNHLASVRIIYRSSPSLNI